MQDWPVEAADAIAFIGWDWYQKKTVGEAETFFAKSCFESDRRTGSPADCRHFLNWYDDTPRNKMRKELIQEINLELIRRWDLKIDLELDAPVYTVIDRLRDLGKDAYANVLAEEMKE